MIRVHESESLIRALYGSAAGEQPARGERPELTPCVGCILVRVEVAGLNPDDTRVAFGMLAAYFPRTALG